MQPPSNHLQLRVNTDVIFLHFQPLGNTKQLAVIFDQGLDCYLKSCTTKFNKKRCYFFFNSLLTPK